MKQFFFIVFGGLALIVAVFLITKVGFAVKSIKSYSAIEEEDKINTTVDLWSSTTPKTVTARSFIVINADTGSTTLSREEDTLVPIASLTKLVTAAIAGTSFSEDARISVPSRILKTYGNSAGFKAGEVFTAQDLLYPLLMISSNDAAEVLASAYGRKDFLKVMNEFAQSIGAYRTYFDDPAGLSPNSVSTARDVAIILDWIYKNQPDLLDITLLKTMTIRSHTWVNPTHFLSWSYYLGGKNGYTPEADRTGASIFRFSSTTPTYIVVVLGSQARDSDVVSLVQQIKK